MPKNKNRFFPECASCKLELGKRICFSIYLHESYYRKIRNSMTDEKR